jgi:MSHA biogenesis protein MshO
MGTRDSRLTSGFTLIELIAVIVLISIIAVMGSGFMIQTLNSYHQTTSRTKLVQTGRQAIEQITRNLRIAVPNSIRVSAKNLCIEWLPVVAGANYLGDLPDQSNAAPAIATIATAPISFDFGIARYVAVSPLSSAEVYNSPAASMALYAATDTSSIPHVISFSSPKQFVRNSVNQRLFLADHPHQFCVSGGALTHHQSYTTGGSYPAAGSLTGSPPNAGTLLALGVVPSGEVPFSVSAATEDRNTIITIQMPFEQGGEKIVLEHEVMIRNVP